MGKVGFDLDYGRLFFGCLNCKIGFHRKNWTFVFVEHIHLVERKKIVFCGYVELESVVVVVALVAFVAFVALVALVAVVVAVAGIDFEWGIDS